MHCGIQCLVVLRTTLQRQRQISISPYTQQLLALMVALLKFRLEPPRCTRHLSTVLLLTGCIRSRAIQRARCPLKTSLLIQLSTGFVAVLTGPLKTILTIPTSSWITCV